MRDYTRITVALSKDEFTALRETAAKEYRHPREQARWLLRQVLGIAEHPVTETQNGIGRARQDTVTNAVPNLSCP